MTEKDPFAEAVEKSVELEPPAPPAPEFAEPPTVENTKEEEVALPVSPPDPNVHSPAERKRMEDQDTAAIIFSIMDDTDRRIVQFFSRPFLKKQIMINNALNGPKLAIYFDESKERVATRIRMLSDIGAIFFEADGTPVANQKIVQFISTVAPTY